MSKANETTQEANASKFNLQFEPADIVQLAQRYGYESDDDALAAGLRIRSGNYGRSNIETIFEWKTKGRGRSRLRNNSDEEIAEALGLAAHAKTERAAIAVLLGLQGVHVPVASAILTAIDPERYTVIDFRALEALGSNSKDRSVNFYLEYLDACRKLAKRRNVTLRDLDRALWQWSSEQEANRVT
jgi:hypothetical protein